MKQQPTSIVTDSTEYKRGYRDGVIGTFQPPRKDILENEIYREGYAQGIFTYDEIKVPLKNSFELFLEEPNPSNYVLVTKHMTFYQQLVKENK